MYFQTSLSQITFTLCILATFSSAVNLTTYPTDQYGVIVDFNVTNRGASKIPNMLSLTGPQIYEKERPIFGDNLTNSQIFGFGYDGAATNMSFLTTYTGTNTPFVGVGENIERIVKNTVPEFLIGTPQIIGYKVLVTKVNQTAVKNLNVGLRGAFAALPGKLDDVLDFINTLGPIAESEDYLPVWAVVQIYNETGPTSQFAAYNFYESIDQLNTHLAGPVPMAFKRVGPTLLSLGETQVGCTTYWYKA